MQFKTLLILLLFRLTKIDAEDDLKNVTVSLIRTLEFLDEYYYQLNLDALLGITLAQAQLLRSQIERDDLNGFVQPLLIKYRRIATKIKSNLPTTNYRDYLFQLFLTNPNFWLKASEPFQDGQLRDLGYYENWTINYITEDKSASYKGVPSDTCFMELLHRYYREGSCNISPLCLDMMLANRIDRGYLLTHRLMYVLMLKIINCLDDKQMVMQICSLVLKEVRTNEAFGFPQHDIFLEQVVLCGMSGHEEFLSDTYRKKVMEWLTPDGCYLAQNEFYGKFNLRSTNVIEYGCTDHTTGLGAASLTLNLYYLLLRL